MKTRPAPFEYTRRSKELDERKYTEVDRVNAIGPWVIKSIALLGAFILALVHDGTWIYVFFGMAMVLLGVELRSTWVRSDADNKNGRGGI